jgi:hypothetical protein
MKDAPPHVTPAKSGISSARRSSRRGNQEGSITQLSDGRWQARLSLDDGTRKALYAKTRQEAARKLNAALQDRDLGLPVVGEKQTLGAFLTGWLETVQHSIRPSTWTRYAELVNLHLIPTLGRVPLAKLTPQQVERVYARKLEEAGGRVESHHGTSPTCSAASGTQHGGAPGTCSPKCERVDGAPSHGPSRKAGADS